LRGFVPLGFAKVGLLAFAESRQQEHRHGRATVKRDHADPAALALAPGGPSKFPGAAGSRHNLARVRGRRQMVDKSLALRFRQQSPHAALIFRSLDHRVQGAMRHG
jgi:hypothetical protein